MQNTDGDQSYPQPTRSARGSTHKKTGGKPRAAENQQPDTRHRHCAWRRGFDIALLHHARMRRLTQQFSGGALRYVPWHFIYDRPLQLLVVRRLRPCY